MNFGLDRLCDEKGKLILIDCAGEDASQAQALAGTLNVSMANAGIGLGAIIGGSVIQHWGLPNVGYVAAGIAILAVITSAAVSMLKSKETAT